jgi:GNAT superfamily N-acetyltransferase
VTPAPTPVSVRRARREDWPRMVVLHRELARFERMTPPDDAESARLADQIFDSRAVRGRAAEIEAFVAEIEGRIEGIAIFWEGLGSSFRARPFLFLEDLVVSETARSRGVGEALVAAVAREGVARGAVRIDWSVLDWNEGAMRFYRRLGAGPTQEWVRYSLEEDAMRALAGPAR